MYMIFGILCFQAGSLLTTKLLTSPYILAPEKSRFSADDVVSIWKGERSTQSNTLLFAYCLSADQRWLLVTCTDATGKFYYFEVTQKWWIVSIH